MKRPLLFSTSFIAAAIVAYYLFNRSIDLSKVSSKPQEDACRSEEFSYSSTSSIQGQNSDSIPMSTTLRASQLYLSAPSLSQVSKLEFSTGGTLYFVQGPEGGREQILASQDFSNEHLPLLLDIGGRFPFFSALGRSEIVSYEYQLAGTTERLSDTSLVWTGEVLKSEHANLKLKDARRISKFADSRLISVEGQLSLVLNSDEAQSVVTHYSFQSLDKSQTHSECYFKDSEELIQRFKLRRINLSAVKAEIANLVLREKFTEHFDSKKKLEHLLEQTLNENSDKSELAKLFAELSEYFRAYPEKISDLYVVWDNLSLDSKADRVKALVVYDLILDTETLDAQLWGLRALSSSKLAKDETFVEHGLANLGISSIGYPEVFSELLDFYQNLSSENLRETAILAVSNYGSKSDQFAAETWQVISAFQSPSGKARTESLQIEAAGNLGDSKSIDYLEDQAFGGTPTSKSAALDSLARTRKPDNFLLRTIGNKSYDAPLRGKSIWLLCGLVKSPSEEANYREWLEDKYIEASPNLSNDLATSFFNCILERGASKGTAVSGMESERFKKSIIRTRSLKIWEKFSV